MLNDGEGFGFGDDCGETVRLFGAKYVGGKFDLFEQDVAVEEEDGAEGLILGGCGDVPLGGEVCDEGLNFRDSHFGGMALIMMEDVALAPIEVGLFGTVGVVLGTDGVAKLVEEFFPLQGRCLLRRHCGLVERWRRLCRHFSILHLQGKKGVLYCSR